ncbi:MAG: spondin domain-containing protein [Actinomycetota bacterium]
MRPRRTILAGAAAAGAAALALVAGAAASGGEHPRTYRVTIENLTGGQPLTPPILAVHAGRHLMFEVGEPASREIREIAENGDLGPMAAFLGASPRVAGTAQGTAPLVPAANPGNTPFTSSVALDVTAGPGARRLSWASMLVCTNDGFTGVDGLRLPRAVGQSVVVTTNGYDAGTEANTEDFGDIVPPCQGLIGQAGSEPGTGVSDPDLETNGVIRHHRGIRGREDLTPALHGWTDPVARVTVTRTG